MSTPTDEMANPHNQPPHQPPLNLHPEHGSTRSSDEEGTFVESADPRREMGGGIDGHDHLHVPDGGAVDEDDDGQRIYRDKSPSQAREQNHRLNDDLEMLRAEQVVSNAAAAAATAAAQGGSDDTDELSRTKSVARTRSRHSEPVDDFDVATNPLHAKTAIYKPPENPTSRTARAFKRIHNSSFLVRYLTYITPLVLIILIPLLLGALLFKRASVGGVKLLYFSVWLEVVWLTLWAGRIVAKCIPYPLGLIISLFTNNSKKWRDMIKQLEVPATVFFWWLGIEVSFLPIMKHNHLDGNTATRPWETIVNKIIITILAGTAMNFFVKIMIQLIAISFHLRTYADRIEINKFQIGSLTKLYAYSKDIISMEDSDFDDEQETKPSSGTRTPMQYLDKAQRNARGAISKVGDVAGKVAGDFTGKQVTKSTHPHQVVLTLLSTPHQSQVLARRLYRTFVRDGEETVAADDLKVAFDNEDEAEAAFQMFDKDLNGDISMEELEAVCVDIGRERKSITASLKDLDSVVSKLDDVFFFFVCIITLLIFLTLISTSTASVLTSAGSTLLALSWLFSTTAQEFLQSVIFVFVKHPFDVGDRVSIYGNTGAMGRGDDYFVKEIALLYTEFKKMEGHVVQAPNSYLNTLFILNMRRSGGLAEAVPVTFKFGTTLDQIDSFRSRLVEFVTAEKREYQSKILTELREVTEAHAITLNVVFFYKSNWQNELLRLQRRNKFICAMMVTIQELGIEGPRMRYPGQKESYPVYLSNVPAPATATSTTSPTDGQAPTTPLTSHPSILRHPGTRPPVRHHAESLSAMGKRVDFSLGMRDMASGDMMSDLYDDRTKVRIPESSKSPPAPTLSRTRPSDDGGASSMARTTSRESAAVGNSRASEDSEGLRVRSSHSLHRNRFFGRKSKEDDLEGGGAQGVSVPMARIAEGGSGAGTKAVGTPVGGVGGAPVDPRTGVVSPVAVGRWEHPSGGAAAGPAGPGQEMSGPTKPMPRAAGGIGGIGDQAPRVDVPLPGPSATADFEPRRQ